MVTNDMHIVCESYRWNWSGPRICRPGEKIHIGPYSSSEKLVPSDRRHAQAQSIRDLPRAKAAYNDYAKDNRRVSCFEGTRQALLSDIGEWIFAVTESLIYVLSGLAGIGKSTVAQTIAERAANLGIL